MNFTQDQKKIIEQINGPVIAVACPGSGKTTTILERTKHMIDSGIAPTNILVVTFTKNAADEMSHRFCSKYQGYEGVTFSTIHSLCFSVLCRHDNLDANSILKAWEQFRFFKEQIKDCVSGENDLENAVKEIIKTISFYRNAKKNLNELKVRMVGKSDITYYELWKKYTAFKNKKGKVDFDDMLVRCHEIYEKDKQELAYWQNMFTHIIIDEFQDTNLIQAEIFYMLSEKTLNICVVGDDDQSIYGFRSADSSIMLNFKKTFPTAKQFALDTNYRSGTEIVRQAANLIEHNKNRFSKQFKANSEESGNVIVKVFEDTNEQIHFLRDFLKEKEEAGENLKDFAVLYRMNKSSSLPTTILTQAEIPFHTKDVTCDIHKEFPFQDMIAYYRLANTPIKDWEKNDILTALLHPAKFLKKTDWEDLKSYDLDSMRKHCNAIYKISWQRQQNKERIENLYLLIQRLKGKSPQKFCKMLFNSDYRTWAKDFLKYQRKPTDELDFIFQTIKDESCEFATMEEWMKFILGYSDIMKKKNDKKEGVTMSTFHGAKGLEWDTVFIIDANRGITPYAKALEEKEQEEEERRMFYVAVTRAKTNLYILSTNPSPYLWEMNPKVKMTVDSEDDSEDDCKGDMLFSDRIKLRKDAASKAICEDEEKEKPKAYVKKRVKKETA